VASYGIDSLFPRAPSRGGTWRLLPASLTQLTSHGVACLACTRGCVLHDGSVGYCSAVTCDEGDLYSTAYGVIGEISVTPIENRPVYHYAPGSRVLCLGGIGCNLRCAFCQNWEIAFRDARHGGGLTEPNLSPEHAIALALARGCAGIAFTFNEPSISPAYTLDFARLAHEAGLFTVFVTNGMMTHAALDLLGPWIDVYRIDVKSLEPGFYRRVAATERIADVLPVAQRAKEEFGVHVEAVTNLMPSLNDSNDHLKRLAASLAERLGSETPWHLSSYVPYAHMRHIPPTPAATLHRARAWGVEAGLRFVYTDDPAAPETAQTRCPTCDTLIIARQGHHVTLHALTPQGACALCGTTLGIVPSRG
jgi:pyruvate formate lyase activating enzyme